MINISRVKQRADVTDAEINTMVLGSHELDDQPIAPEGT